MNEEHLFEIDIFINVFIVTFDQLCHKSIFCFVFFYTKNLNGSTSGFQKKKQQLFLTF